MGLTVQDKVKSKYCESLQSSFLPFLMLQHKYVPKVAFTPTIKLICCLFITVILLLLGT